MDKKGDEKYYIVISLILGLLILGISLYFLFQEYFNQDEIDWETCRQSIVMRNSLPEKDLFVTTASGKDAFPLKCKTQVINIKNSNKEEAEKVFADTLASCWYLVGNGEFKIYANENNYPSHHCIVCARIHIDPKLNEYYTQNQINYGQALLLKTNTGKTYLESLLNNNIFAFPHWVNIGDNFDIVSGGYDVPWLSVFDYMRSDVKPAQTGGPGFIYPDEWNISKGDTYIVISTVAFNKVNVTSDLLYLQQDDLSKLSTTILDSPFYKWKACDTIESVPA